MKIIRCTACGEVEGLSPERWKNCSCGESGGAYERGGDRAIVAGRAALYGLSNRVFRGQRAEAWPYDESNGKIRRLDKNPGDFPDRLRPVLLAPESVEEVG